MFLLAWEIAARLAHSRLLPPFTSVFRVMLDEAQSGRLEHNLGVTLLRVGWAFAIAMVLGTALGVAMGRSPAIDRLFDSPVTLLLNLPALVGIVLIFVWFGLSETTTIAAVALNKFPATAVTMREGARAVEKRLLGMARSFGLSHRATWQHVILPQLSPYVFAAARAGFALVWKIVLVAELLGRSDGVGFQIQVYFQLFDVTGILAYTLAFMAVVQAIEWALVQPVERRINRWR